MNKLNKFLATGQSSRTGSFYLFTSTPHKPVAPPWDEHNAPMHACEGCMHDVIADLFVNCCSIAGPTIGPNGNVRCALVWSSPASHYKPCDSVQQLRWTAVCKPQASWWSVDGVDYAILSPHARLYIANRPFRAFSRCWFLITARSSTVWRRSIAINFSRLANFIERHAFGARAVSPVTASVRSGTLSIRCRVTTSSPRCPHSKRITYCSTIVNVLPAIDCFFNWICCSEMDYWRVNFF